jgi:hypothetical protein
MSINMKFTLLKKEFIDSVRCRNGNLEISIHEREMADCEL